MSRFYSAFHGAPPSVLSRAISPFAPFFGECRSTYSSPLSALLLVAGEGREGREIFALRSVQSAFGTLTRFDITVNNKKPFQKLCLNTVEFSVKFNLYWSKAAFHVDLINNRPKLTFEGHIGALIEELLGK